MDDATLISDYLDRGSEPAFSELVQRHYGLVFSAAFRRLNDRGAAADVAQAVFVLLAQQSPRLRGRRSIAGWLHQTSSLKAREHLRAETRRRAREQKAALMEPNPSPADTDAAWAQLAPLLDEALGALRPGDREAVLMRFFQGRALREIGASLGVDEDAARKRVSRALESLRSWFQRRGVMVPTAALGAVLAEQGAESFPPAVALAAAGRALKTTAPVALSPLGNVLLFMASAKTPIIAGALAVAALLVASRQAGGRQPNALAPSSGAAALPGAKPSPPPMLRRASLWVRSAGPAHALDPALEESLARLRAALFTRGDDAARQAKELLNAIPLRQRGAALGLIAQALDHADIEICQRGVKLLPLIWPDGDAALPKLWELLATRAGESPTIASDIMVGALQVAATTGTIPELASAAIQGSAESRAALEANFPLLRSLLPQSDDTWRTSLQPFLYSPDPSQRLAAAVSLAALPGPYDPTGLSELTAALAGKGSVADRFQTGTLLGALASLGSSAASAAPDLQQLAANNPGLADAVNQTLKAIVPADWTGIGVPTPLPPHDTASTTLLQGVTDGAIGLPELIAALGSADTELAAARALADLGTNGAPALAALRQALNQAGAGDPATAVVLAATMERLDPTSAKPLIPYTDLVAALGAVQAAAQSDPKWPGAVAAAVESPGFLGLMTQAQLVALANRLGQIDPSLRGAFATALQNLDSRYGPLLAPKP